LATAITGQSHIVRWQSGISSSGGAVLTLVRHFECTSTGDLRFSEKIDRHDEGHPESISDLFIAGLRFLKLAESFYRAQSHFGSLSLLHLVDCYSAIEFLPTFPGASGIYHPANGIGLNREQGVYAHGNSTRVQEVENLETGNHAELVCEFMLGHLRQLCQASVDYESLRNTVAKCPLDRPCFFAT
jgi:hypothetical protein